MKKQLVVSKKLNGLVRDERGNMTEYIILIGVIALLCIAAFKVFGSSVGDKVKAQADTVTNEVNDTAGE